MIPKHKEIFQFNHILIVFNIFLLYMFENSNLNLSLSVKPLFISDNFQSNFLLGFMVKTFNHLPKTAPSKPSKDLVAIRNVLTFKQIVVPSLIIITFIFSPIKCFPFFILWDKIYIFIRKDF